MFPSHDPGGDFTKDLLAYYLDMIIKIERDMNAELLDYFDFNKKMFNYHYQQETLWEAYELAKHTDKITIVNDIKNSANLFTYRRPMQFLFGYSGITYIMPGYQEVKDGQ